MALELLREEIQMYVCITVATEFKILLNIMLNFYSKDIDPNFLIKTVIKFLIVSSRQKINSTLNLGFKKNNLGTSTNWLYREFQIHDSYYLKIILQFLVISTTKTLQHSSCSLCISLIENSIIKLSNIIVHDLFSEIDPSKQALLKFYTTDSFLFSYRLSNIKLYLYWKWSIEKLYLEIRRLSEDTYSIFVCTKSGFSVKKILVKTIKGQIISPKFYKFLGSFLNFVDYIFNVIKTSFQFQVIEKL
jgi:hypothetical protein